MNFFGHAVLAAKQDRDPRFVLGSMLPDLVKMAVGSLSGSPCPSVAAGIAHHYATDRVFHETPSFVRWNRAGVGALRTLSFERGPARGAAHVGIELLLDVALYESAYHVHVPAFQNALRHGLAAQKRVAFAKTPSATAWQQLHQRLLDAGPPSTLDPIAGRVLRALHHHPRLCPPGVLAPALDRWLRSTWPQIRAETPQLLLEMQPALQIRR